MSSPNTLKSGLDAETQFVLGETREEFAQLQTEYCARFTATTPEIRFQIDNLIRNEWMLRRYFRVEAQLWEYHSMLAQRGTGYELGEGYAKSNADFMRLQRRITAAEKSYKDAKAELDRLLAAQPEQTKGETEQLGSFRKEPDGPRDHPSPPVASSPKPTGAHDRFWSPVVPPDTLPHLLK